MKVEVIGFYSLTGWIKAGIMARRKNAFIGPMKRSEKGKRALTGPVDQIQNRTKAPSIVPAPDDGLGKATLVELVELLARRVAERDFPHLIRTKRSRKKSNERTPS